ncbi:probable carboxylesterase 16 [Oryza glaberrima]|uniref:Alpha/beta hydrolase fold-3 domain-containing protein n=1 Tax=Oryza glaberrima TaxID=4538 RepID=I1R5B1_ORYGL|nr:probable carboxylesterase 16 [Oryza glaberrima]
MPPVAIQLYSLLFKLILRRRLSSLSASASSSSFGVSSRAAADHHHPSPPSNPSFSSAAGADAVATKDLHPDPLSSLHLRLFLPNPHHSATPAAPAAGANAPPPLRRNSFPQPAHDAGSPASAVGQELSRRASASFSGVSPSAAPCYGGYLPTARSGRRLPVIVQFHGGAFATGAADSAANDAFCRRVARLCDAIVVAVGYRLAPESRYPAAFEDGVTVLKWIAKQANLAACGRTMARGAGSGGADSFGAALVEPWLAAHADPSRCVLLGVSCGANIADYVARKAVEAGKLLDPIKVVAQVLMYPFFMGTSPTQSELKLANSYFYDKSTCLLAWKLFLPEGEFSLDHPAANPLVPGKGPPLKLMPPTLTVVAELDWMKDRAIAYSEELRKVNVDAPVLEYKDAVHEFATLDVLLKTPLAQACTEDIAIWVKKYISLRGHELSY